MKKLPPSALTVVTLLLALLGFMAAASTKDSTFAFSPFFVLGKGRPGIAPRALDEQRTPGTEVVTRWKGLAK